MAGTATRTPRTRRVRAERLSREQAAAAVADFDSVRAEFLITHLGGVSEVARLLGVSKSQPSRWRTGQERPKPEVLGRLIDLEYVISNLHQAMAPEAARIWFASANDYLDGVTPEQVLAEEGPELVVSASRAETRRAFSQVLVYRVFPYLSSARKGQAGHPEYLYPGQRDGRLDNPAHYLCWYLARAPEGAIGEVFANFRTWTDAMFEAPFVPGARKAFGTFEIDDDLALLDLDDAKHLLDRGLRPTQVVRGNRSVTQAWAREIFEETDPAGDKRWNGVQWWSFNNPNWEIVGAWNIRLTAVNVEALDTAHPAVVDAARALARDIA